MQNEEARSLHAAARAAHERGEVVVALTLFRTLLERHPAAEEAADAVYYMTSGHRRRGSAPVSAGKAKAQI